MIPVLADKYTALQASRDRMLDGIRALSTEQSTFQATPESWSPLQVAHHVFIAEQVGVDAMVRLGDRASKRRNLVQKFGYVAVWLVMKLGIRVKSPARRTTPDPEISFQELENDWNEVRDRLEEFLDTLDEADLKKAGFMHPVAGPLNLREGLMFMNRHLEHHLRQLDRIRRHPNFPAA